MVIMVNSTIFFPSPLHQWTTSSARGRVEAGATATRRTGPVARGRAWSPGLIFDEFDVLIK